ncbi:GNAT family N-acetyltransferase [Patescibacteria group bacterium]|nr:GNAT family N-acetyltransferase [Patescibacteria group bacterium]
MIREVIPLLNLSPEGVKFMTQQSDPKALLEDKNDCFILKDENNIYATATLKKNKVERVFTNINYQKKGFGKLIMQEIFNYAIQKGFDEICTNSVKSAVDFYKSLGFESIKEVNIDCILMVKKIK